MTMEAQPEIHCIGKSGIVHLKRPVPGTGTLCSPKTAIVSEAHGETEVTCKKCRQMANTALRKIHREEEIKTLPIVFRDQCDGAIRVRKLDSVGRIIERRLPFVTMAAAEQWLEMYLKYRKEHGVEIEPVAITGEGE